MTDIPSERKANDSKPAHASKPGDFVGGLLELGRNWALAVAVAGAGLAAFGTELVTDPPWLTSAVFYTCLSVAIGWIWISVERFQAIAFPDLPSGKGWWDRSSESERWRVFQIRATSYLVAFPAGLGIIIVIAHMADNNRVVQICSEAHTSNNKIIASYDECKLLYRKRLDLIEKLEGKQASPE